MRLLSKSQKFCIRFILQELFALKSHSEDSYFKHAPAGTACFYHLSSAEKWWKLKVSVHFSSTRTINILLENDFFKLVQNDAIEIWHSEILTGKPTSDLTLPDYKSSFNHAKTKNFNHESNALLRHVFASIIIVLNQRLELKVWNNETVKT